jgi:hypothetical protein
MANGSVGIVLGLWKMRKRREIVALKITTKKRLDYSIERHFFDENGERIAYYTISKNDDPNIEIWSPFIRKVDPETDTIGFLESQLLSIPDRVEAFLRLYLGQELTTKILKFVSKDLGLRGLKVEEGKTS